MVIDISKGKNLLVEKNLTSKTLQVHLKVNFEPRKTARTARRQLDKLHLLLGKYLHT